MPVPIESHRGANAVGDCALGGVLQRIERGDKAAQGELWLKFYPQVVRSMRRRFRGLPRPAVDEEDLAVEVLLYVLRRIAEGTLHVTSERQLRRFIAIVGFCRFVSQVRHERLEEATRAALAFTRVDLRQGACVACATCDEGFEFEELLRYLLELVSENSDRLLLAGWWLGGFSSQRIAAAFGMSRSAVNRKIAAMRAVWRPALNRVGFEFCESHGDPRGGGRGRRRSGGRGR